MSPLVYVFLGSMQVACFRVDKPHSSAEQEDISIATETEMDDAFTPPAEVDADDDGYPETEDCDDSNPSVHPDMTEVCNEVDDNCNDLIDEDVGFEWFQDNDNDGYGALSLGFFCEQPLNGVLLDGDCNDEDPAIHPNSTQQLDGVDGDCNGLTEWLVGIYVAVDDAGELCVNGNFIDNTGGWVDGSFHQIWLESGTHAIGIKGWDTGTVITATIAHISISDGSAWYTDTSWHYDPDAQSSSGAKEGWCDPGFDESQWGNALAIHPIGAAGSPWGNSPLLFPENSPALWIWDHFPVNLNTQYLRKEITLP